jgi:energy-coupling factor transporter ATP-binding protein EcfA2
MKNIKLYDKTYQDELSFENRYVFNYNVIPSSLTQTDVKYSHPVIEHLEGIGFVIDVTMNNDSKSRSSKELLLINDEKRIYVRLIISKLNEITYLKLIYDGKTPLETQIDIEKLEEFQSKRTTNISLVSSSGGYFDLEDYTLKSPEIDLSLNYGEDFVKVHEKIFKKLNTPNEKGIVLLHGDPGTGKTTYLKYLANTLNKQILFIPPSMAESLSEPAIIPFLMGNTNTILIIEDAEKVISDRETNGSSVGVSNILNLTDGILGDCLNIQIIATFNMSREKIDNALLRKGRLIAEHKFQTLNITDTNKLLKHLKKDVVSDRGMVLSDIYNIDDEEFKTTLKPKIGFNV